MSVIQSFIQTGSAELRAHAGSNRGLVQALREE